MFKLSIDSTDFSTRLIKVSTTWGGIPCILLLIVVGGPTPRLWSLASHSWLGGPALRTCRWGVSDLRSVVVGGLWPCCRRRWRPCASYSLLGGRTAPGR